MTRIDSEEEAIAHIRSIIDQYNAEKARMLGLQDDEPLPKDSDPSVFGSSSRRWPNCSVLERSLVAERGQLFKGFEDRLRRFITSDLPDDAKHLNGPLKVCMPCPGPPVIHTRQIDICKCAYITYSSVEDFREARDILRSNADWYGKPRYDCALLDGTERLNFARLQLLFRCKFDNGKVIDLAAVTRFSPSQWKPRTVWRGCRVLDEKNSLEIINATDIIRGALLCPAFGAPASKNAHYLVDCIDGDMFLRANDLAVPFNEDHFKEKL